MTKEVLKSELDLFKNISFQGSIENSQTIQYRPIASITDATSIEFNVPVSSDEYLDLQNVFLWITGQVVNNNGENFDKTQDNRYGLIHYGLNTIWDQIDIYLG